MKFIITTIIQLLKYNYIGNDDIYLNVANKWRIRIKTKIRNEKKRYITKKKAKETFLKYETEEKLSVCALRAVL